MKSKTKIKKQIQKKTNSVLVKTILQAKKNEKWHRVAELLSLPRKKRIIMNLSEIDEKSKNVPIVVIPGKVLSQGELNKKLKIIAFNFSESATEKILNSKSEISYIIEEIKKNPLAEGIKILE